MRRLLCVLMLLIGQSGLGVLAQERVTQTAEPERFAIVVGNAKYVGGTLQQLGSPCEDAGEIANALTDAGWTDVQKECDVTNDKLRALILSFVQKVQLTKRAFGIFYYSGHGVQVKDRNYIFGIDADVNLPAEEEVLRDDVSNPLFTLSGIDLDLELTRLNNMWAKAAIVILDACRDNPIFSPRRPFFKAPAKTTETTGLVYGFATRNGVKAPDATGFERITKYSKALASAIRESKSKSVSGDGLLNKAITTVERQTHLRQRPDRAGNFFSPPDFCIVGCPSLIDDWKKLEEEEFSIIDDIPWINSNVKLAYSHREVTDIQFPIGSLATSDTVRSDANQKIAQNEVSSAVPSAAGRTVRFDIFWCTGEGDEQQKMQRAKAASETVYKLRAPFSNYDRAEANVRILPPAVNARPQYQMTDDAVFYSKYSPDEKAWAEALVSALGNGMEARETVRKSADYLSVFVCKGVKEAERSARVYVQIATEAQRDAVQRLNSDLAATMPTVTFMKGIEVVAKSPVNTEVRYFTDKDKADAEAIAEAIKGRIGHSVEARYIKGYAEKLKAAPVLEVWYSAKENF